MVTSLTLIYLIPLALLAALVLILLLLGARAAFTLPPLTPTHHGGKWREHFDYQQYGSFAEYLADERAFIDQIYHALQSVAAPEEKYGVNSANSPYLENYNWNASFEIMPERRPLRGGVLLVHGLTDSPYHLRTIAQIFAEQGYYVICLRLPGHGTAPGALVTVRHADWSRAVAFAGGMVLQKLRENGGGRFAVGGFSTGGALTLQYTLQAIRENRAVPDQLFLFSPAIAVTPVAFLANWHKLVAWLPFYEKFRWTDISREDDPFKYRSFPKNAADQIHLLTKRNRTLAQEVASDPALRGKMPPMLAFQSPVDATVRASALVDLFNQLGNAHSELVWFDINHAYAGRVNDKKIDTLTPDSLNHAYAIYRLIFASNRNQPDTAVKCYASERAPGIPELNLRVMPKMPPLSWPARAFALSHVCIPISPDDPVYGEYSQLGEIPVGSYAGEKGVLNDLADTAPAFQRIRYNPFFAWIKQRIEYAVNH